MTGQYARWALCLQEYEFTIVHRPVVKHQNADCLSRMPIETTFDGTGARLDGHPTSCIAQFMDGYNKPSCYVCGDKKTYLDEVSIDSDVEVITSPSSYMLSEVPCKPSEAPVNTCVYTAVRTSAWECKLARPVPFHLRARSRPLCVTSMYDDDLWA